MSSSWLILNLVMSGVAATAVGFACLYLRPRVGKHRPYAVALATPGAVLAGFAVVLTAAGAAAVSVPVWCGAALCFAASWAFWPTPDRSWRRFEEAFRAHVAHGQDSRAIGTDGA